MTRGRGSGPQASDNGNGKQLALAARNSAAGRCRSAVVVVACGEEEDSTATWKEHGEIRRRGDGGDADGRLLGRQGEAARKGNERKRMCMYDDEWGERGNGPSCGCCTYVRNVPSAQFRSCCWVYVLCVYDDVGSTHFLRGRSLLHVQGKWQLAAAQHDDRPQGTLDFLPTYSSASLLHLNGFLSFVRHCVARVFFPSSFPQRALQHPPGCTCVCVTPRQKS